MMRACVLLALVASSAAALSAAPAGLRPSVSAFRSTAQRRESLELRGGSADDFKIDASTALKTTAVTMSFFSAACWPGLLPAIGLDGKVHDDQVSLYYDVTGKQTEEVDKTMTWCSWAYAWLAGANWVASESKDEGFKKDLCKVTLAAVAAGMANLIKNNQPWQCGAHVACVVLGAVNGAALV